MPTRCHFYLTDTDTPFPFEPTTNVGAELFESLPANFLFDGLQNSIVFYPETPAQRNHFRSNFVINVGCDAHTIASAGLSGPGLIGIASPRYAGKTPLADHPSTSRSARSSNNDTIDQKLDWSINTFSQNFAQRVSFCFFAGKKRPGREKKLSPIDAELVRAWNLIK